MNKTFNAPNTQDVQTQQRGEQSQGSSLNGAHILAFHDASAILKANNSPSDKTIGLLGGLEIVGCDALRGAGSEIANHTGKIATELAKGAIVGAAGEALVTAGMGAAVALGVVASPEIAAGGAIAAGVGAAGYGVYEGYNYAARLVHDARKAISGDSESAAEAQKDARNAGGDIVEATAGLSGGEASLGALVAADAKFGLRALAGKTFKQATTEGEKEAAVTSGPDVATRPNALTREQTEEMLASDDPNVRAQAVRNGQLTTAEMRKAAGDNEVVRKQLAGRKDLPGELYWKLSQDNDESVVASIARNTATPNSVIDNMVQKLEKEAHENAGKLSGDSHDPTFKARNYIAGRSNLSAYASSEMVNDPSALVRETLAENNSVPEQELDKLLRDKSPNVSQFALNTILHKQN